MRSLLSIFALLLATQVSAQTEFFRLYPGHPSMSPLPPPIGAGPAVEVDYPIGINMRSLVLDSPTRAEWALRMPGGDVKVFREARFTPHEGFVPLGEFDVQPDPQLPDSRISWDWFGTLGRESLTVSVHRGKLSATLIGTEKNYAVTESRGQTVFRRINPRLVPPDLVGSGPRPKAHEIRPTFATAKFSDPIDVLVVHTPAALAAAGSRAQLNAVIAESFSQANLVVSNSGIVSFSLRNVLAGQENLSVEVNYNENGVPPPACDVAFVGAGACRWIAHRFWLRTNSTVQATRNSTNADLVIMFVADQLDATGVAYVQRPDCGVELPFENTPGCSMGAGYGPFAVSVVSTPWATLYQVFAHEIGHQLGMEHNIENASPTPSYPWSHGRYVSNLNETIMSIASAAGLCSSCPRSLQFSNPNVPFLNSSVPSGTTTGAWNARTGTALAPAVSEFRAPRLLQTIFRGGFEALPIP